jgi:hypothetical protein
MQILPSIFILSAGAAVLAIIGFLIARRVVSPIKHSEHQNFLDAMLGIVGTLVSILLGLLVAAALDRYQVLEQSVDTEAADVSQIMRLTIGLPPQPRQRIRQLCFEYCLGVVNDEWPLMSKGQSSEKVFVTYAQLVAQIARLQPSTNGETNIHNALITAIQQIGDSRRHRIMALHSAWTAHLMPVLIMCSVIVLGFAYLYVRRGELFHGVLICFVAIALGGNLGLVYLLSQPFSGDWSIRPTGFELNIDLVKRVQDNPELKKLLELDNDLAMPAQPLQGKTPPLDRQ